MRKILSWLRTGRRPLWAAAVIVVLIIVAATIKPIADYATAQPQNATLVAALTALLGILAAQIVNTILAVAGQRNQQELEDRRAQAQQELEADRAQAARFQAYLEQIGRLLIDHQLGADSNQRDAADASSHEDVNSARVVAQAQTLAVLEGESDSVRKRLLLLFLYDSALINKDKAIISLSRANLERADLRGADLTRANLGWANLSDANLEWAYLSDANLERAYLSGCTVTMEQLAECKSLEGATMPDGSKHD